MWVVITAIGILTALLLWIYDKFVLPKSGSEATTA